MVLLHQIIAPHGQVMCLPQSKLADFYRSCTWLRDMVQGLEVDSGKHWKPSAPITSMTIADKTFLVHSGSRVKMKLFIVNPSLLEVRKRLQKNFQKEMDAFSLNLKYLLLQEIWSCRCVMRFFTPTNYFNFHFFKLINQKAGGLLTLMEVKS